MLCMCEHVCVYAVAIYLIKLHAWIDFKERFSHLEVNFPEWSFVYSNFISYELFCPRSAQHGRITKDVRGNIATPPSLFHHPLWSHHPLCETHCQHTVSCRPLPHPLRICETNSSLPHLQHHTSIPAWGPCPQCKLYGGECQWCWDLCTTNLNYQPCTFCNIVKIVNIQ